MEFTERKEIEVVFRDDNGEVLVSTQDNPDPLTIKYGVMGDLKVEIPSIIEYQYNNNIISLLDEEGNLWINFYSNRRAHNIQEGLGEFLCCQTMYNRTFREWYNQYPIKFQLKFPVKNYYLGENNLYVHYENGYISMFIKDKNFCPTFLRSGEILFQMRGKFLQSEIISYIAFNFGNIDPPFSYTQSSVGKELKQICGMDEIVFALDTDGCVHMRDFNSNFAFRKLSIMTALPEVADYIVSISHFSCTKIYPKINTLLFLDVSGDVWFYQDLRFRKVNLDSVDRIFSIVEYGYVLIDINGNFWTIHWSQMLKNHNPICPRSDLDIILKSIFDENTLLDIDCTYDGMVIINQDKLTKIIPDEAGIKSLEYFPEHAISKIVSNKTLFTKSARKS